METCHQTSYIRGTFVGNKIVDHSDVVGASPAGAAPTTYSRLNTCLQWIWQRQLQDETRIIPVFGFGAAYIRDFTVNLPFLTPLTLRSLCGNAVGFEPTRVSRVYGLRASSVPVWGAVSLLIIPGLWRHPTASQWNRSRDLPGVLYRGYVMTDDHEKRTCNPVGHYPQRRGTQRNYNVIMTSKRYRFDVVMTLFCVVCRLGHSSYLRVLFLSQVIVTHLKMGLPGRRFPLRVPDLQMSVRRRHAITLQLVHVLAHR